VGGAAIDDDGVPTNRTPVIENGILERLVTNRTPVQGQLRSTGNQFDNGPVTTNIYVSSDSGVNDSDLRRKLLALVATQGVPYGIIVRRLANPELRGAPEMGLMDFFMSMMTGGRPAAPPLTAIDAARVYADGREEELRNAELSDLGAGALKQIVAASRSRVVYAAPAVRTGMAGMMGGMMSSMMGGAAFGHSRVSWYVVPSILLDDVTIQGPRGNAPRLPVAPSPLVVQR